MRANDRKDDHADEDRGQMRGKLPTVVHRDPTPTNEASSTMSTMTPWRSKPITRSRAGAAKSSTLSSPMTLIAATGALRARDDAHGAAVEYPRAMESETYRADDHESEVWSGRCSATIDGQAST